MGAPRLTFSAPAGFHETAAAAVALPEGAPSRRVAHTELADGRGSLFLAECFAAAVPGWSPELEAPVTARTIAMLVATSERRLARGITAQHDPALREVTLRAAETGDRIGTGRTLLGFDGREVHTCYVACVGAQNASCRDVTGATRLIGGTLPPAPGALLSGASLVIEQPRGAAAAVLVAASVIALVAVLTRRKARSRA